MEKKTVRTAAAVTVTSTALLFDPTNTGGTIRLLSGTLSADTDGVYQLQDGSGGTTIAAVYLAAKTAKDVNFCAPQESLQEFGAPGKQLTAATSLYAVGPSGGKLSVVLNCSETGF